MKRWIAVLILLAIISAVCTGSVIYVGHSVKKLNHSMEATIQYAKTNQSENAMEQLKHTQRLWEQHRDILMIYIDQDLLDEMDNQLALLSALLIYHKEEFLPQAILCLSYLEEIQQRETLSKRTWF